MEYLEKKYRLEVVLSFMDRTDEVLNQISIFPESGIPTPKASVRKGIVTEQTAVFYEIYEETIELLHFWDNRQDPEKQETLIK